MLKNQTNDPSKCTSLLCVDLAVVGVAFWFKRGRYFLRKCE